MFSSDRWLFHQSTRELWANNPHFLNLFVMETTRSKNPDERNVVDLRIEESNEDRNLECENEDRCDQFGEINTVGVKTFIFSGRGGENDEHKEGVGILMTKL
jgi:hypothetical protein